MEFKCPICSCAHYDRASVSRPDGKTYATEFYFCMGCTAMFLEPALFTAAYEYQRIVRQQPLGAPEQALARQRDAARYWLARATREDGGFPATSEQASELRQRHGR